MYRLLEIGEVIESGDEWYDANGEWRPNNSVGLTYVVDIPLRRLVKPAVTPAADPVKPDPAVSVGDRVTVLSGPWAGCTGVVIEFDYPQGCVVNLDHVHVGGSQLSVVSPVEKLAPVVPEVLYRDLSHGETIRQGDQFWTFGVGPWAAAGPAEIGGTINVVKARHRRPARLQSPGWRYLDAGETVRPEDEASYGDGESWGCCDWKVGKTVQNGGEKYFRRKLPLNMGG